MINNSLALTVNIKSKQSWPSTPVLKYITIHDSTTLSTKFEIL